MNEREPIRGAVLLVKKHSTHSEVHDVNCPVIDGEVVAGQLAYDSLMGVPMAVLEDPERLALALGADGRVAKFQPCCLDEGGDDGYAFSITDDLEEFLALALVAFEGP
jgi:hypothetical protein